MPAGWRLRFPTWSVLAGVSAATGLHEPSEQLFVTSYVRPDDGVIDVGANVGIYAVACAALDARVVALEPSTLTRTALEENIRINHLEGRVRVYAVAAGEASRNGQLTMSLDACNHLDDSNDDLARTDQEGTAHELVDVRTLDSLLKDVEDWLAPHRISLVKVDAEGHDLQVLRGASRLIESHRPVILVESWEGGTDIRALLADVGYRVHRYDIDSRRLVEYPGEWAGQCNFIAVPRERLGEIHERLAERPHPRLEPPRVLWRDALVSGRGDARRPRLMTDPGESLTPAQPSALGGGRPRVHVAGMIPPGPSGVADYGRLLADELALRGFSVDQGWIVTDGRSWSGALVASTRFLRSALDAPPDSTVLWHYSSFAYGLHGVPLHGVLFGLVLRARGHRVVTILHEPAYPRGRRGWRGRIHWATQWCALRPIMLGSSSVVVTTERRAEDARSLRRPFRRAVHTLPVFSTLGVPDGPRSLPNSGGALTVGVLRYTGDGSRPDIVMTALARLPAAMQPRLVLLGAPGSAAPEARPWIEAAREAGLASRLMFSGVIDRADLSRQLQACDVLVIPNDEGPSGRFTTVAAALAHSVPTLALDGPERWPELIDEGAVVVVPAQAGAVAMALEELLRSPERRAALGARGRRFYDRRMSLDRAGEAIAHLLGNDVESRSDVRPGMGSPSPSTDG